jgi:putative transposase
MKAKRYTTKQKIRILQEAEGWNVGTGKIQHLCRELGLMVPPKKPRKRRQGVFMGLSTTATHRNHVWTWDFIHDVTMRGGKLRMLTVLDEYTRECLVEGRGHPGCRWRTRASRGFLAVRPLHGGLRAAP